MLQYSSDSIPGLSGFDQSIHVPEEIPIHLYGISFSYLKQDTIHISPGEVLHSSEAYCIQTSKLMRRALSKYCPFSPIKLFAIIFTRSRELFSAHVSAPSRPHVRTSYCRSKVIFFLLFFDSVFYSYTFRVNYTSNRLLCLLEVLKLSDGAR